MKKGKKNKQKHWIEPKIRKIKLDERQILLACDGKEIGCGSTVT